MLSHGGEEGARIKIEKWLNPEKGNLSWLVSFVSAILDGWWSVDECTRAAYPVVNQSRLHTSFRLT